MNKRTSKLFALVLLVALVVLLFGCTQLPPGVSTFKLKDGAQTCSIDGKPVIRLYSTTWCPHCKWVGPTFDAVAKEYVAQGKIVAYHWQMDTKDDALTDVNETSIPESEAQIFYQFNPDGGIPTFVFGCKYYRIGAGYEAQNDLVAEEKEFRAVIDALLAE